MWSLEYEKEGAQTQKVRPQKSGVYMEEPILRVWLQAYIVGMVTGLYCGCGYRLHFITPVRIFLPVCILVLHMYDVHWISKYLGIHY